MKKYAILLWLLSCTGFLTADQKVDNLKKEVLFFQPHLHGWCSKEKALNFIDLILEVKPKLCVEIGVFGGSSIYPVAATLKSIGQGVVFGIDPWDKFECIRYFDPNEDAADLNWWGQVNLSYIYDSYLNMLKGHGLDTICITKKTTSELAVRDFLDGSIDILYIDGNHCEMVSANDVILYLPKVRHGGYIWMNDTLWEQTQHSVDLLLEACDVVKTIDNGNCILFRKR